MMRTGYIGRFAPSPSGPLHAGSLVAAMASYLDARARHGVWRVRIEDVDEARTVPGAAESILHALTRLGMRWDGELIWQSQRHAAYQAAFDALNALGMQVYPCSCSRREIADSRTSIAHDGSVVYPGTCRHGLAPGKSARAFRLRVPDDDQSIAFEDRWLGPIAQCLATEAGDFVLKRADNFWAYQLAVVVDDAEQHVTDVVRGADLVDSTARQIYLQRLLGMPTPRYMHVPVMTDANGEKLSKQTGAAALDLSAPLATLKEAALFLGLHVNDAVNLDRFWLQATEWWSKRFGIEAA